MQSLSQFEFELPSIAKQEDLADILWTAQETRSHYRQLLTACNDVVKSQFVEMFGEPAENPKGWETSSLTSLGSCKNGMNFKSKESGIELPCLGVGDFKDRSVINDVSEMGRINLDDELQKVISLRMVTSFSSARMAIKNLWAAVWLFTLMAKRLFSAVSVYDCVSNLTRSEFPI